MYTYDFKLEENDKNVGTVYLPSKDSKNLPVVIYCHGWKGRRNLWTQTEKLCETAMENNIALVTFDFFGCGETGGDYGKMTYRRWNQNLSDIIDFVETQAFADKNKIGCYSFSAGSMVALRLAAKDKRIAFIISVGTCITTNIFMNSDNPTKCLSDNIELLMDGKTINDYGIDFCRDFVSNAPVYTIKEVKCPVLFLQGTADNIYRITDAKIGYEIMKANGSNVKHVEIEHGTHELENVADEAMGEVFDWLMPILS